MISTIKNIVIIVIVVAGLVFGYIYFFDKTPEQGSLTSSLVSKILPSSDSTVSGSVDTEFITTLLGIKNIKLNDALFSNVAFKNLRDSSIILTQQVGSKGRRNPFSPIGSDVVIVNEVIQIPVPAPEIP